MALIECNECGKEISDRADTCPNCGNPIKAVIENAVSPEEGAGDRAADANGNDDAGANKAVKNSKNLMRIGIGVIAAIALIALIIVATVSNNKRSAVAALQDIQQLSLDGAIESERACILTRKVWYNTIFKEADTETDVYTRVSGTGAFNSDFNDSLSNLYVSDNYLKKVATANVKKDSIKEKLKEIENHPATLDEHYEAANELYSAYKTLYNLADNPSGNIQTYTSNYNDADTAFMEAYEDFAELMEDFE